MASRLANRIAMVAPSATMAMAARAARLRAEGHKVYNFSVGEPDFDTPEHIRSAGKAALDAGATHYTAVSGVESSRPPSATRASATGASGPTRRRSS
jgi:aspartate aminotransferase